jgi:flagellar basal-body rod modification protein FlgD
MEINATALTQASATTSQVAETKLAESFDNFLKLLTTQLRFQDPLDPLNSNEFVAQLVQFTQVEQAIATNKKMDQLVALQQGNLISVGLDYIGRTVESNGETAPLRGGKAAFSYTLNANSVATSIAIFNAEGQAVFTTAGETATGRHDFIWDGLDGNGDPLPEGAYRFAVTALNEDGEQIQTATTATAQVTGVENSATGLLLLFGTVKVPFENIVSVRETPPPDPAA